MADCFSLPNAAELVAQLRSNPNNVWMAEAADAIEQLVSKCNQLAEENAKLKAERDAYVQLFSKTDVWKCPFCAHNRQPHRMAFADCDVAGECKNTDALPTHFELRGVKEADDANDNASDNR